MSVREGLGLRLMEMFEENYNVGTFQGVRTEVKDRDIAGFRELHKKIQESEINTYQDFKRLVAQYNKYLANCIDRLPENSPYKEKLIEIKNEITETFTPIKEKVASKKSEVLAAADIENLIQRLKNKATDLEKRGHKEVAKKVMETYNYMQQQSKQYKLGNINLDQFKQNVTTKLEDPDQVKLFNTHRGLKPIHKHLLLACTFGIGHLVGGIYRKTKGKGFLLFQDKRTDTQKTVDKLKKGINELDESKTKKTAPS